MDFVTRLTQAVSAVQGFVWGPVMLLLLVGCGIWLTLRTGFLQITRLKLWWDSTIVSIFKDKKRPR